MGYARLQCSCSRRVSVRITLCRQTTLPDTTTALALGEMQKGLRVEET